MMILIVNPLLLISSLLPIQMKKIPKPKKKNEIKKKKKKIVFNILIKKKNINKTYLSEK
jgi:hypothetical protein